MIESLDITTLSMDPKEIWYKPIWLRNSHLLCQTSCKFLRRGLIKISSAWQTKSNICTTIPYSSQSIALININCQVLDYSPVDMLCSDISIFFIWKENHPQCMRLSSTQCMNGKASSLKIIIMWAAEFRCDRTRERWKVLGQVVI